MGVDVTENLDGPSLPAVESGFTRVEETLQRLNEIVAPQGFEVHPFLIGWYNEHVDEVFQLDYPEDTVAYLLISTPAMFERTFVPFIFKHELEELRDPIDQCMVHLFRDLLQVFPQDDVDVVHDFELHGNKRPKLLAQTAAHVSGAAFLYHIRNLVPESGVTPKKMMGLCLHPKYGGWFAIRGCLIFRKIFAPKFPKKPPTNVLTVPADQLNAIELFNFHWRDGRFRDVIPVKERYSDDQQLYFNTPPGQRRKILDYIRKKHK